VVQAVRAAVALVDPLEVELEQELLERRTLAVAVVVDMLPLVKQLLVPLADQVPLLYLFQVRSTLEYLLAHRR
jgi:hypothetical protein